MQSPKPQRIMSRKNTSLLLSKIADRSRFMDIHSKKRESSGAKKRFSLKAHGITAYHAAPAVLMTVAGLALSTIISDVPPNSIRCLHRRKLQLKNL